MHSQNQDEGPRRQERRYHRSALVVEQFPFDQPRNKAFRGKSKLTPSKIRGPSKRDV
jgi:hypothetical protein